MAGLNVFQKQYLTSTRHFFSRIHRVNRRHPGPRGDDDDPIHGGAAREDMRSWTDLVNGLRSRISDGN